MNLRALTFTALTFISGVALAHYEVDCNGENEETGDEVTGTCTDGDFAGEDSNTGNPVSGDCEFDGSFRGEDKSTGQPASGQCEGE